MLLKDSELKIDSLCQRYDLGEPVERPQFVTGGLLHRMIQLKTTTGSYAVKLLNPEIMKRSDALNNYLTSEVIARTVFEHGIPAIPALVIDNNPLQVIDGVYVLVFDWMNGGVLPPSVAKPGQCRLIGSLLARIHNLDFSSLKLNMQSDNTVWFTEQHWTQLLERGYAQKLPWAEDMESYLHQIMRWTDLGKQANSLLCKNVVLSHRDLDQKNVLWENERTPCIIDWEAAGPINPTKELVSSALIWSGEGVEAINKDSFDAFISGYVESSGAIIDDLVAAMHSNYLEKLGWLEFNMRRSLGEEITRQEEQELGVRETIQTKIALEQFSNNSNVWCRWLDF